MPAELHRLAERLTTVKDNAMSRPAAAILPRGAACRVESTDTRRRPVVGSAVRQGGGARESMVRRCWSAVVLIKPSHGSVTHGKIVGGGLESLTAASRC